MMPNVASAIRRFESTLQFQLVTKTVTASGDIAETPTINPTIPLWFEGNLQPMPQSKIIIKPEGQRDFQWWTLFTDLELTKDQVIKDEQDRIFRVMNENSWEQAGYFAYELIQGVGL